MRIQITFPSEVAHLFLQPWLSSNPVPISLTAHQFKPCLLHCQSHQCMLQYLIQCLLLSDNFTKGNCFLHLLSAVYLPNFVFIKITISSIICSIHQPFQPMDTNSDFMCCFFRDFFALLNT